MPLEILRGSSGSALPHNNHSLGISVIAKIARRKGKKVYSEILNRMRRPSVSINLEQTDRLARLSRAV